MYLATKMRAPDTSWLPSAVFPVLPFEYQSEGRVGADPWEQGSAFFLSTDGLFLTAKHVVSKYPDASHYSVLAFSLRDRARKFCRVKSLERHPELDVAIGMAERPGNSGWGSTFTLARSQLNINAPVLTYGYAKTGIEERDTGKDLLGLGINFRPKLHDGRVQDFMPDGTMYSKGPSYLISGDPGHGISGSPIVRRRTLHVHAVISSGMTPTESEPYTQASDVRAFVDSWRIPFLENRTLREHAKKYPKRLLIF